MKNILYFLIWSVCAVVYVHGADNFSGDGIENRETTVDVIQITHVQKTLCISETQKTHPDPFSTWILSRQQRVSADSICQQTQNRSNWIVLKSFQLFSSYLTTGNKCRILQETFFYTTGRAVLLQARVLRI